MNKNWKIILAGILGIHLLLLIFLKFTAWPEMLLWPYLSTQGWLPYENIAIAHTPFMLFKLAAFYKIFGTGIIQLKIFTWLLILFTDTLLFFIAKKLWSIKTAIYSLSAFVLLGIFFDGNGLWFDPFMGFLALISFYFVQKKNWLYAGVFLALAFFSKQTAVWFFLPIFYALLSDTKRIKENLTKFALGGLSVSIATLLTLVALGILPDFWRWAVNFGIFILPKAQGQMHLPDLKNLTIAAFPFLVLIPFLFRQNKESLKLRIHLTLWAFAGTLGSYPRFEYFHFLPALPYLAIAASFTLPSLGKEKGIVKTFLIFYLIGSLLLLSGYILRNFREGVRFYENDVVDVVSYVKANTNPKDKIFVMNWWDNVYALTETLPATDPWVPQLPWYQEAPGIQEEQVKDLSDSRPALILLNPYTRASLAGYIPKEVFKFVNDNYTLKEKVGGIEILVPKTPGLEEE